MSSTLSTLQHSERLEQQQKKQLGSISHLKEVLASSSSSSSSISDAPSKKEDKKLRAPWEEHFSERHQVPYYYNPVTRESTWKRPIEAEDESDNEETDRDERDGTYETQREAISSGSNVDEVCDEEFMGEEEEEALYLRLQELQRKKLQHQECSQASPPGTTLSEMLESSIGKPDHSSSPDTNTVNSSPSSASVSSRSLKSLSRQREQVELMYFRAEESNQRKEMLRKEYRDREAMEITGKPQLNTKYQSQNAWENMSLSERAALLQANKEAKEAAIREELERAERESMRDKPEISKHGKKVAPSRKVDDMLAWDRDRRQRLEKMAQQKALEEAEKYKPKAHLSKNTNRLLQEQRELRNGMTVEERLLEYEEKKRLKRIQALQKQNLEAKKLAARGASSSKCSADTVNRLYEEAIRKKAETSERLEREAGSQNSDAFQPKLNKNSLKLAMKSRPRHVPVEESLCFRGHLSSHKASLLQQRSLEEAKRLANERKINAVSEKILQEKYGSAGGDSAERLAKPIGTVRQKTKDGIEEPTFRPQICTKSSGEWGSAGGDGGDVYSRSQKWLMQKQLRLERERKERESKEMTLCSFKPNISSNGGTQEDLHTPHESRKSLAERHAEWASIRDQKVEMGRREREAALIKECSFTPSRATAPLNPQAILDEVDRSLRSGVTSGLERDRARQGSPELPSVYIGPRRDGARHPPEPPSPPLEMTGGCEDDDGDDDDDLHGGGQRRLFQRGEYEAYEASRGYPPLPQYDHEDDDQHDHDHEDDGSQYDYYEGAGGSRGVYDSETGGLPPPPPPRYDEDDCYADDHHCHLYHSSNEDGEEYGEHDEPVRHLFEDSFGPPTPLPGSAAFERDDFDSLSVLEQLASEEYVEQDACSSAYELDSAPIKQPLHPEAPRPAYQTAQRSAEKRTKGSRRPPPPAPAAKPHQPNSTTSDGPRSKSYNIDIL